ncbi:MAG: S-layer homology domain-containing protein [Actinobacteria bacterium]|nr:S-layer homology domain-containing protein [Actinomycetota bacterium]
MNRKLRLIACLAICMTLLFTAPFIALALSYGSISGTVVAAGTNAPIQGIYVEVKPVNDNGDFDSTRIGTYKTYTLADGRYTIGNLPAGKYKIIFSAGLAQNDTAKQYVTQYYNGKPTWESADSVLVQGGLATSGINASLSLGGRISGNVSGAPIATVFAIPVFYTDGLLDTNRDIRHTSIDSSGNYTVIGLASGYYKVEAYQNDYADAFYNNKTTFLNADMVFVGAPNQITGINLTLVPGISGSGGGPIAGWPGGPTPPGPTPPGPTPGTNIPAPTGLKASYADGVVTLSWNPVSAQNLAGYNVYRALDATTGGTKLNSSVVTSSTYKDGTVDGPKTYYYYVVAVNSGGQEGHPSTRVKVEITDTLEPVPFSDVGRNHWAFLYIKELAARKIVSGYPDGTFKPDNKVTRAEFAKMIVLANGWELIKPSKPTFPDVPATDWAYSYVETAKEHGVIEGYPDGTFRPTSNIKRSEIATMVVRSKEYPINTSGTGFPDVPQTHWAYSYIMTAKNKGIINGYPDGTFKPEGLATRAESAKMIYMILQ